MNNLLSIFNHALPLDDIFLSVTLVCAVISICHR